MQTLEKTLVPDVLPATERTSVSRATAKGIYMLLNRLPLFEEGTLAADVPPPSV